MVRISDIGVLAGGYDMANSLYLFSDSRCYST